MLKRLLVLAVWLLVIAGAVIVPLEIWERMLADRPPLNVIDRSIATTPDLTDPKKPGVSLFQYDLYPFTGGHTQADATVAFGRFRTGKHGFMIDFDLDAPPPKRPGEIRLVLTGGSAAAGHGATTNVRMLHNVMERRFNQKNVCADGRFLTVINLAMGGSRSYQNFIALNRWAHRLAPDAILSFAGNNDALEPAYPDFSGFQTLHSMMALSFASNNTSIAATLARRYPNIVNNSSLGLMLRAGAYRQIADRAWRDYIGRFPDKPRPEAATDAFVHAIQSIRRDFAPIPVIVAYQPFMASVSNPGKTLTDWNYDVAGHLARYDAFIASTSDAFAQAPRPGPMVLFDVHAWYQTHHADTLDPGDGTHMFDNKQKLVGDVLIDHMGKLLCGNR